MTSIFSQNSARKQERAIILTTHPPLSNTYRLYRLRPSYFLIPLTALMKAEEELNINLKNYKYSMFSELKIFNNIDFLMQ
jgi:hypothetical protein